MSAKLTAGEVKKLLSGVSDDFLVAIKLGEGWDYVTTISLTHILGESDMGRVTKVPCCVIEAKEES